MKKLVIIIFIILGIISYYYYSTSNEYRVNLSTNDKVGTATDIYLIKFPSYPATYSNYLFHKYEINNLKNLANHSAEPYLKLMNFVNAIENKEDIEKSYINRTYELENLIICLGLDQKRVEIYRHHLKKLFNDQYFKKKYNSFNDDSVYKYCNK